MYLIINGNRHTVSRRIVRADEIRYLSVTPKPETVSGKIQMYEGSAELPEEVEVIEIEEEIIEGEVPEVEPEQGDFLISEDDADSFERWTYSGTLLILTNVPEPVPVEPTPVPEPTAEELMDILLGVTEE